MRLISIPCITAPRSLIHAHPAMTSKSLTSNLSLAQPLPAMSRQSHRLLRLEKERYHRRKVHFLYKGRTDGCSSSPDTRETTMNPVEIVLSLTSAHPWLPPLLTTPTPLATLPSPMQRAHAAVLSVWTPNTRVTTALIPAFSREGVTCGLAVIPGHVSRFALHDETLELLLVLPEMIIRLHPLGIEIVRHSASELPLLAEVTGFETHNGHGGRIGRVPQHPLDYSAFAGNIALLSGEYGLARVDIRVDETVVGLMCDAAAEREGQVQVNGVDFGLREADVDDGALRRLQNREAAQRSHFRKRLEVDRLSREIRRGWEKVTELVEREKGLKGENDWLKKLVGW